MEFFYNLGIRLFGLALHLAAPFNVKAGQMLRGRKETWQKLRDFSTGQKVVWIHCASLGEFEQGRPLIEAIRAQHPGYKIVLTFFSPSGYEVRKNYNLADVVVYLPGDTAANARRFINAINPAMAIFVKYEYWYHYYTTLKKRGIPVYSVSSIFRESQVFFKWYGGWYRRILMAVTRFYVQDEQSGSLLKRVGISNFVVAGDTRFDRVAAIAAGAADVPVAREFAAGARVIVAGSSWPADEAILAEYLNNAPADVKMIVAPHEVHASHINQMVQRFRTPVVKYSESQGKDVSGFRVLIIDTIGLLSAIYRYGSVAYIGGGFGKGIHNTLEAATYGMPVIFGPNHKRFKEAVDLIRLGGGFAIHTSGDFMAVMGKLWDEQSPQALEQAGQASASYVQGMCGATPRIMSDLF